MLKLQCDVSVCLCHIKIPSAQLTSILEALQASATSIKKQQLIVNAFRQIKEKH